jgi:hypothetical protein
MFVRSWLSRIVCAGSALLDAGRSCVDVSRRGCDCTRPSGRQRRAQRVNAGSSDYAGRSAARHARQAATVAAALKYLHCYQLSLFRKCRRSLWQLFRCHPSCLDRSRAVSVLKDARCVVENSDPDHTIRYFRVHRAAPRCRGAAYGENCQPKHLFPPRTLSVSLSELHAA